VPHFIRCKEKKYGLDMLLHCAVFVKPLKLQYEYIVRTLLW
jgi:hypothetical protein